MSDINELLAQQKNADFQRRSEAFSNELKGILTKYQVQFAAVINYSPQAIIPGIQVIDVKDQAGEGIPNANTEAEKTSEGANQEQPSAEATADTGIVV